MWYFKNFTKKNMFHWRKKEKNYGCFASERFKKILCNKPNIIKALDGVSLTVEKGEFIAVVGPSGSGKSTLLHMIGGLDTPSSGNIIIEKQNLRGNNDDLTIFRRRHIGFIFQNYNLVPILNVYNNIVLPLHLDGRQVDQQFLDEVLTYLELEDKKDRMPNSLSGGQQQRVAIARALITKPSVILADEPTGNLDSETSKKVLQLLRETSKKYDQTIIMITHDLEMAKQADRIVKIIDGKIIA